MRRAALLTAQALILPLALSGCVLDWDGQWPVEMDRGLADQKSIDTKIPRDISKEPGSPVPDSSPDLPPPPSPWIWTAGGTGHCDIAAMARTPDGGLVAVGSFSGPLSMEVGGKTINYSAPLTMSDVLVVKLDVQGKAVWQYVAQGLGQNRAQAVSVDSAGRIWVVGDFEQKITFPKGATGVTLSAKKEEDIFVLRLSPKGVHEALAQAGGPGKDIAQRVVANKDGTAYVAGIIWQGASFTSTGGIIVPLTANRGLEVFLAKFNGKGKALWVQTAGGSKLDELEGLDVSPNGRIYLAGKFRSDPFSFVGDAAKTTLKPMGTADVFVASLMAASGTNKPKLEYLVQGGGTGVSAEPFSLVMDSQKRPVITGFYYGDVLDFGGKKAPSASKSQLFVAALDNQLKTRWLKAGVASGGSAGQAAAVASGNRILVAGHFQKSFSYAGSTPLTGWGDDDIVVLRLNPLQGTLQALLHSGASGPDRGWSVLPYSGDTVLVAGAFSETVKFNGVPKKSDGLTDGFVWRVTMNSK